MNLALQAFATTDISDYLQDHGDDYVQIMQCSFVSFGNIDCFAGRARTLVTCEDSGLAKQFYQQQGHGAIAIVDGAGSKRSALLGDMNAAILVENGWSGIIIYGAIRDSNAIKQLPLGVKALGTTPVRSSKKGHGCIDVPVAFAGCYIEPQDCIYADADGVLISKHPIKL